MRDRHTERPRARLRMTQKSAIGKKSDEDTHSHTLIDKKKNNNLQKKKKIICHVTPFDLRINEKNS